MGALSDTSDETKFTAGLAIANSALAYAREQGDLELVAQLEAVQLIHARRLVVWVDSQGEADE